MKVLFDIMALGAAYSQSHGRTGIFRVVENLARGLAASERCEVSFVSTLFPTEASAFLSESEALKAHPLIYPSSQDILLNRTREFLQRKEASLQPSILRQLSAQLAKSPLLKTSLKSLATASDIYHSPYMPVPKEVQENQHIKRFLTVHDLIPIRFPQYFENNHDPLVKHSISSLKEGDWAFCVSQSTKDDLCEYSGISPERVFVSHLAASKEVFYPCGDKIKAEEVRKKYSLGEEPYFLSLCTLEPRKNIVHTIKCFVELINQGHLSGINLVLAGTPGWDFEQIFAELKSTSVRNRIITTGFVEDVDLATLYSEAIAFLYPSLYEGFGLPPLEALQCGTPVITSNVSSLPEVVGQAGITVSPSDKDALCSAMLELSENDALRNDLSKRSIQQAAQFSWDKCIQVTLNGYRTALEL